MCSTASRSIEPSLATHHPDPANRPHPALTTHPHPHTHTTILLYLVAFSSYSPPCNLRTRLRLRFGLRGCASSIHMMHHMRRRGGSVWDWERRSRIDVCSTGYTVPTASKTLHFQDKFDFYYPHRHTTHAPRAFGFALGPFPFPPFTLFADRAPARAPAPRPRTCPARATRTETRGWVSPT